ncbi:ROK family protein [Bacillus sp. REN16]|uniref:ROK family protein n=1 Tax=Bacillus sp. REN16 TaxID=2887296 RepID=UPI001E4ACEA6|nr:ROK family protein [Bacillus sp. REN16]MCC3355349.1 ROK family protein [Bacillus sp. REN16]
MKRALGVDIGGTKIAAAIIDEEANILYRSEVPSDPSDKEKMFEQVVNVINNVLDESHLNIQQIEGIGLGVPGILDRDSGIAIFQNNLPWKGFPIVKRIKEAFPVEKVVIDNDVYMAAFAEWQMYGANQNETFVYFTISTGIAVSIIHNGDFIRGMGFAGELGLFPVKAANGIERLEQAAAGPAIQRLTNNTMTSKEVLEKYQQQDEYAHSVISNVVESLAHGCYAITCILDPQKIVFGGGVINNNAFLLPLIKQKMEEYCIPDQKAAVSRLHISQSKGDAGVLGAGLRVFNRKGVEDCGKTKHLINHE